MISSYEKLKRKIKLLEQEIEYLRRQKPVECGFEHSNLDLKYYFWVRYSNEISNFHGRYIGKGDTLEEAFLNIQLKDNAFWEDR